MGIPALATQKKIIKGINSVINTTVLAVTVPLMAFAGYGLWDSKQIYQAADKSQYAVYKPAAADEGKSFQELQALNAEVFAWVSVYGTNIDYPVTQGTDNMKYVNTNAEGLYSLSGAIFLDYAASPDFSDFNSILYGHHMEKKAMFGEIGSFAGRDMFDSRRYGSLYFGGKDHGVEFFAFVHTDAYDSTVFTANLTGEQARQAYLDNLLAKAVHKRDITVTTEDRIVLLSTCSAASTNGRDILAGRITDRMYENAFSDLETNDARKLLGTYSWGENSARRLPVLLLFLLLAALVTLFLIIRKKRKRSGGRGKNT